MRIKLILVCVLLLAGCASGRAVFMQNRSGDYKVCEVTDEEAGWMGIIIRDQTINSCVRENRANGYWSVSERSSGSGAGTAATGAILQGVGQALQSQPPMQPNQNTNCTSQVIGNTVYTNCH